tara:strand:+ start:11792 stop:12259 length:468 start_codon:yes stop_codon:yes gene_type:complete
MQRDRPLEAGNGALALDLGPECGIGLERVDGAAMGGKPHRMVTDIAADIENRRRPGVFQMRKAILEPGLFIGAIEKRVPVHEICCRTRVTDPGEVEGQRCPALAVGVKEQAQKLVPSAKDAEKSQSAQAPRKGHAGCYLHPVLFLRQNAVFRRRL